MLYEYYVTRHQSNKCDAQRDHSRWQSHAEHLWCRSRHQCNQVYRETPIASQCAVQATRFVKVLNIHTIYGDYLVYFKYLIESIQTHEIQAAKLHLFNTVLPQLDLRLICRCASDSFMTFEYQFTFIPHLHLHLHLHVTLSSCADYRNRFLIQKVTCNSMQLNV